MAILQDLNFQFGDGTQITTANTGVRALFGFGNNGPTMYSITNLVTNFGYVATDTTGVAGVEARYLLAAAGYGGDKAIFAYGSGGSVTNLVSNIGVVATDTAYVGTPRAHLAAAGYGGDKAIFGYGAPDGSNTTRYSVTNKVSNIGVVATDTTGVGTARSSLAAAAYGFDKAIFGYGSVSGPSNVSVTNLVSNAGVVATDTTGVGTARRDLAAAGYGYDKAIFAYGSTSSSGSYIGRTGTSNLVSNQGVVATDTTGVGTSRSYLAAAGYGGDKAIFGYGFSTTYVNTTNLVSNVGVVAANTTGVGSTRYALAAASYAI